MKTFSFSYLHLTQHFAVLIKFHQNDLVLMCFDFVLGFTFRELAFLGGVYFTHAWHPTFAFSLEVPFLSGGWAGAFSGCDLVQETDMSALNCLLSFGYKVKIISSNLAHGLTISCEYPFVPLSYDAPQAELPLVLLA